MFDYDITIGFRRENFGLASNSYEQNPLISTSMRYGANRYLTPQLLIQTGDGLQLGGAGLTFLAGSVGVFDISAAASRYNKNGINENGTQTSISYDYSYKKIGINANYLKHYGQYRDLGSQHNNIISTSQPDARLQIAASLHDNKWGSFNIGYFRMIDEQEKIAQY